MITASDKPLDPGAADGDPETPCSERAEGLPALATSVPGAAMAQLGGWVDRVGHRLAPLIGLVLFAIALFVLRKELADIGYRDLSVALAALPAMSIVLAIVLTAVNYLILTGYDHLALVYVGKRLAPWRVTMASFVGYAVSNSVGLALLSGTSVRYRFYSRWGLRSAEISRIVAFYSSTFFLGLTVLGGLSLAFAPLPGLVGLPGHQYLRVAGAVLFAIGPTYAALALVRRTPLRWRGVAIALPRPPVVAAQFALVLVDWVLAVAVLHVLLPSSPLTFLELMAAFLAAQVLVLLSHVPGGVGVFETAMLLLLKPFLPATTLLPALLLFRFVYYLLPLVVAMVVLLVDELSERRERVARVGVLFGRITNAVAPKLLATFTFGAGAVLLFSGATPELHSRMAWLVRFLPLSLLEASHFVGSLVGVALLLLSHGVARRLDVAYYFSCVALAAGIVVSLLKGGDFEEAAILGFLLLAFLPSRAEFDRKAAFFAGRFSPGWTLAVLSVVGASFWLGLFAYRHVEYSNELWWNVGLGNQASRFLRASLGAMVGLLIFGVTRLMRPAPPERPHGAAADLAAAEDVIARQTSTTPCLVFLKDKALLWNEAHTGFVMYGVQGRTWVALGDPVAPMECTPELIRLFLERCDDFDGRPVFYQVRKENLHCYADLGLSFIKLGEEALVPLDRFNLDGAPGKPLRKVLHRVERGGARFRIIAREQVVALLPALRTVSDNWLRHKGGVEKSFSLGSFVDDYVTRFPAAVVEVDGRIVAFAVLWSAANHVELSVDLMRHTADAPLGTMEALLIHLMFWGRDQGYRSFNLGVAPLSGIARSPIASSWSRLAGLAYRHGDAFYNFQGLRTFKDKFHPEWQPRYLAYPGGLSLLAALADVSALIAGGYHRIFR
jgi:phosphatidylglycerol lysyltransferase